jgi:hypothetical protein
MWIMGLEDEFASTVASVKDFKFAPTKVGIIPLVAFRMTG